MSSFYTGYSACLSYDSLFR